MQAQRLMLETDEYGHLTHLPQLPANTKVKVIFLLLEQPTTTIKRKPSTKLKPLPKNNENTEVITSIFNNEEIENYSTRTAQQITGVADAFK